MRKIPFMWMLILSFVLFPDTASAQDTEKAPAMKMDELTIQVMPEYTYHPKDNKKDQIPLLVGYHGTLRNNTNEPQKGQIQIPLPVTEKNFKIGFVGDYSSDLTAMYDINYELDTENGVISWETSEEIEPQGTYKFVIEYYTNSIEESKDKKALDYHFKAFSDIGIMSLVFVEPLQTESFTLEPAANSHQENSFGMNMFVYLEQGLKAGEEKTITLNYERQEKQTSEEIMMAMTGLSGQQAGEVRNEEIMPVWKIIVIVGGITLTAAGILFFFLKRRTKKPATAEGKSTMETRDDEKIAKLRSMLIEGTITEEEYQEMASRIGGVKREQK